MPSPRNDDRRTGAFGLPPSVWYLGLAALFNDTASEAIYPLLPLFLTTVLGAGAFSLGIIEGTAEATNSLLKIFSGYFSDRWRRRRPIVASGYALAGLVRPFISVVRSWPQLFAIRFTDRIGKGVRGAPRDAMLAAWATPATRGRVFGFERAMDHTGAVLGPSLATLFLIFYPGRYRLLFALAAVPGAVAVVMALMARERRTEVGRSDDPTLRTAEGRLESGDRGNASARRSAPRGAQTETSGRPEDRGTDFQTSGHSPGFGEPRRSSLPISERAETGRSDSRTERRSARLPRSFYSYLAVLLLFALGNSTDAFLLLRLGDVGVPAFWIPLLWASLHVVKATVSVVGGNLSDRFSRRSVIGIGWGIYALVYAGFALSTSVASLVTWFLVYGFYYGFSESSEKALVADLAPPDLRGTAFGIYDAVLGIGALAASLVFGYVWKIAGAPTAFAMGASLALAATIVLFLVVVRRAEPRT